MTLITDFERVELPMERPFTIARGTTTSAENVIVTIEDDLGNRGVGGAAPSRHYGETISTVMAVLPDLLQVVERFDTPEPVVAIEDALAKAVRANPAAKAAISIALHDLIGKRHDLPVFSLWGLDNDTIDTSFTIGIDEPHEMADQAAEAVDDGYSILKIKLGTKNDREIIESIRRAVPHVTLRIDANEAWDVKEAVKMASFLDEHDIEFIEQPVPAEYPEALAAVGARSVLPIAADESCITLEDIPAIASAVDIANIKLMKCGGLLEARRMVHAARAHGLEVMLGCMAESNASIAGGAHLAPMLDYADLDGSLLLADDPYDGPVRRGGAIELDSSIAGIGTTRVG